MLTLLFALACTEGTKPDTNDDTDTDTDTDTDSGGACAAMSSGDDWYWTGECPQMRTPCDIVVDGCSLTIDYDADGGMTMGMPYAGTIAGDTVSFEDGDYVKGCVGVLETADKMEGTCEDGCTFTLRR